MRACPAKSRRVMAPAPPPRPLRRSQDLSLYSRASPIRSMAISVTVSQDPPGGSAMSFRLSPPPLPVWRTTDPCGSGTCRRCPELSGLLRAPWSCKASRPICSRSSLRMSLTEKGVEVTGFCSIPKAQGERPGGLRSLRRAAPRAFRPVSASAAERRCRADAQRPGLRLPLGHPYHLVTRAEGRDHQRPLAPAETTCCPAQRQPLQALSSRALLIPLQPPATFWEDLLLTEGSQKQGERERWCGIRLVSR